MAAISAEGAMPVAPSALPQQGATKAAPYKVLNKEWTDATKRLNFKKVNDALNKYGVNVNDQKAMIKAVETLSSKEDLPSITELMQDASSLNKAKSTAAKILIAAQLLGFNKDYKDKIEKLNEPDKDNAIKALILGGRWMVEKGEFIGSESSPEPKVSTRRITGDMLAMITVASTVTLVGPIIIGAIAAGYGIYRAWQEHQVTKWTENRGLPQVVREIATDVFKQLKAIPYEWRDNIDVDFTKKLSSWSGWGYELPKIIERPNYAEGFKRDNIPYYENIQTQLQNKTGIAKFLSEKRRKEDLAKLTESINTLKLLCSPSLERTTDTWGTPEKYKGALEKELERLKKVLDIRWTALGQTIKPGDADDVRKKAIDAVLNSKQDLSTIIDLKEGVQPSDINPPPEEFEEILKDQSLAVIFKTGQKLEEEANRKPPNYEIEILQQKLSITHNLLLQKLAQQKAGKT